MKDFIVKREYCDVTHNQHPNWPHKLFRDWVDAGWVVESVMLHPIERQSMHVSMYDSIAIGVLSKANPANEKNHPQEVVIEDNLKTSVAEVRWLRRVAAAAEAMFKFSGWTDGVDEDAADAVLALERAVDEKPAS